MTNNFEKTTIPAEVKKCRGRGFDTKFYKKSNNKRARRQRKEALRNGDGSYAPTRAPYLS